MSSSITPVIRPRGPGSSLFPSQIQRAVSHELERTVGEALVVRTREEARAVLANDALEAVGSLSALETHLIQIAPIGEPRYRAIVDAFTVGAASTLQRW